VSPWRHDAIDTPLFVARPAHAGDDAPAAFAWSPDGRWLAVAEEHDYDCGDPTGPCALDELWIASAAGHGTRRIYRTAEGAAITSIDWSGSAR
jgi:hypothetical protein